MIVLYVVDLNIACDLYFVENFISEGLFREQIVEDKLNQNPYYAY